MIISDHSFPNTPTEALEWKPTIYKYALHSHILVVARTRIEGKWAAYINLVPGVDHDDEMDAVLDLGRKLPETVARALFPCCRDLPYAR